MVVPAKDTSRPVSSLCERHSVFHHALALTVLRSPKQGDSAMDQVRLRGDTKLVNAIKAAFEQQIKTLKETIVVGVVVPSSQHATKIGRGGSALQDLQRKTNTAIHFPGSRQYASVGEIENKDELESADAGDIVKVMGSKEGCAQAAEQLQTVTERPARADRPDNRAPAQDLPSRSISIPTKYYHHITSDQSLLRSIRSAGGSLAYPQPAPPKPTVSRPSTNGTSLAAKAARIDLDAGDGEDDGLVEEGEWEMIENYQDGAEGELEWVVRAKEDDLDKVEGVLQEAISRATAATHSEFSPTSLHGLD